LQEEGNLVERMTKQNRLVMSAVIGAVVIVIAYWIAAHPVDILNSVCAGKWDSWCRVGVQAGIRALRATEIGWGVLAGAVAYGVMVRTRKQ
jgi:hypothetical protein